MPPIGLREITSVETLPDPSPSPAYRPSATTTAVHDLQRLALNAMAREDSRADAPERMSPGRSAAMIAALSVLGWGAAAALLV